MCTETPNAPIEPANLLLIVIDTLRADHIGMYGSKDGLTPHIDALAEHSHVFENPIATSAWTRSSVASMLTSRFPTSIGVLDRDDSIPDSASTLAAELKARGFATFARTTNGNAGASFGFARGFDSFELPKLTRAYPDGAAMYPAEGVTKEALEWLAERDPKTPSFVFLHYTDPHDPYLPHVGLLDRPEPPGRFGGSRAELAEMQLAERSGRVTDADMDRIKYLYAGEVKYCDIWIGKLIAGLKKLNLWNSTTLVLTADHGEGLWDHHFRGHGRDLYEEMIRVPLIIHYAGQTKGSRISQALSLVDIAPTLLGAVGITPPRDFDGSDLQAIIQGRVEARDSGIYSELTLDGIDLEFVRTSKHKLIRDRTRARTDPASYSLFNLETDSREQENRAPLEPATVEALRAMLERWQKALSAPAPKPAGPQRKLSEADLQSMKALGYLSEEEYERLREKGSLD